MRRQMLKFAAAAAALALAGCAATGAKYDQVAASMPALKANEGRIYFMRDTGVWGAALRPDIKLNGQVVGTSQQSGFFYVDRPAGNYTVTAATETEKTLTFALAAGETKYVRSYMTVGVLVYRVNLELRDPASGKAMLAGLSYTGADGKK
jgi:Flp pilus assembly protein TadG